MYWLEFFISAGIIIFAGVMLYFFDKTPPMTSLVPGYPSKTVSEPADSSSHEDKP